MFLRVLVCFNLIWPGFGRRRLVVDRSLARFCKFLQAFARFGKAPARFLPLFNMVLTSFGNVLPGFCMVWQRFGKGFGLGLAKAWQVSAGPSKFLQCFGNVFVWFWFVF